MGAFVEHKNQPAKEIIDSLQEQYRFVGSLLMRCCSWCVVADSARSQPFCAGLD